MAENTESRLEPKYKHQKIVRYQNNLDIMDE